VLHHEAPLDSTEVSLHVLDKIEICVRLNQLDSSDSSHTDGDMTTFSLYNVTTRQENLYFF